jgi:hypothetical protein
MLVSPLRRGWSAVLAFFVLLSSGRSGPPDWTVDVDLSSVGRSEVQDAGRAASSSATQATSVSFSRRFPINAPWYFGLGGQFEKFRFPGNDTARLPRDLQDFAAQISLSYFEKDEAIAELTIRPGWYYGSHFSRRAWDLPFDAVTGLPLLAQLDGIVGVSNARFYHHAIPVAGLIWTPHPQLRIEAAYPEPAISFLYSETLTLRLSGQLVGGGFLDASSGPATALEYSSYRTGATVEWKARDGMQVTLAAGVETERTFDRFRRHQRWEGSGAGYARVALQFNR